MSLDRPSDDPSATADSEGLALAAALRVRGTPLLHALERHAGGAREHATATATCAFATAAELGLERDRCELIREAAMLHEIGQVYVRAEVLTRPASERDESETAEFDAHHEAAYRLARGAGIDEEACGWLLRSREHFDGSGPEGLEGEQIPIESRLIRAACVFQGALGEQPGSGHEPQRHALGRISTMAGSELDPRVVLALSAVLARTRA